MQESRGGYFITCYSSISNIPDCCKVTWKVGVWSWSDSRIKFLFLSPGLKKSLFILKGHCDFFKPLSSPFGHTRCSDSICILNLRTPVEIFYHDPNIRSDLCCPWELPSRSSAAWTLPLPFHHPFGALFCNNLNSVENSVPCTMTLKLCLPSSGNLMAWFPNRLLTLYMRLLVRSHVRGCHASGASFRVYSFTLGAIIRTKWIVQN